MIVFSIPSETPLAMVGRELNKLSIPHVIFKAQLIRKQGLEVPETLITNDPDLVSKFRTIFDQTGKE